MKSIKLRLFSPLMVKGETPYENPWDGGEDYRILLESEKKKCRAEISDNITEMLFPVALPQTFRSAVYSAVPTIGEKDKRLMLVLDCECFRTLSESEIDRLCDWWEDMLIKVNTVLSNIVIKTKKMGKIFIHIHYQNGWMIEPVFPAIKGEFQNE